MPYNFKRVVKKSHKALTSETKISSWQLAAMVLAVVGVGYIILSTYAATPSAQPSLEDRVKADGLALANAKGPGTDKTAIAKRRKADMVKLIQTDPDAAVRIAVPPDTVTKLGKDSKDQVEETVTIGGMLTHSHGDQPVFDDKGNMTDLKDVDEQTYIENGKDKTYLYTSKEEMDELNGNIVEVTGVKIGDQMAVSKTKTLPTPLVTKGTVAKDPTKVSLLLPKLPVDVAVSPGGTKPNAVLAASTASNVSLIFFGNGYYNNPTLAGVQWLHATTNAADGSGVILAREEWDIDGTPVDIQTRGYDSSIRWDTSGYSPGQHTITYKTVDGFGVPSVKQLTVTVGTTTIKRIALIAWQFQDYANGTWINNSSGQRLTAPVATDWTFTGARSITDYFHEDSYGRMTIQGKNGGKGDTYGVYTIPYNGADPSSGYPYCPLATWELSAKQQAQAAGWDPTQYDGVLLAGPTPNGCGSGQGGGLYDRVPWFGQGVEDWIKFAGHELGHSQELPFHAHSWSCVDASGNKVQVSSNCTPTEYGDGYDIMGSGYVQHMNVYEKGEAGYFPSISAQQTVTVKTAGTYTLSPANLASAGVKSIRIPRSLDTNGNPVDYYYLEFRQPTPYNVSQAGTKDYDGIQIREAPDYVPGDNSGSYLLDTTPNSVSTLGQSDQYDARLTTGQSFQDPATGINIKTTAVSTSGATFTLSYGTPQCERHAPTVSLRNYNTPYPAIWVNPGQTINFFATITNNDSPACGPSNFNLSSTLAAGLTQTPATASVSVGPAGAAQEISFTLSSSTSIAAGYYPFTEKATNTVNSQTGTATGSYNVYTGLYKPPQVEFNSPTANSTLCCTVPVKLDVSGSRDKVELRIDGTIITTPFDTSKGTYDYNWDTTKVANGSHLLSATVTDSNTGNSSTSQVTVTINNSGNADTTAPTVSLTSPLSGATIGGPLTLTATASDAGGINRVDFAVDGAQVGSSSTSPYSYLWDSTKVGNGTHAISATAYDNAGNPASSQVTVTVKNGDITAPTPPSNLTATAASSTQVNLAWTASTDNVGVTGYFIIRNGVTITQTSGTGVTYSDITAQVGATYTYVVEAFDAAGNPSTDSNQVSVTTPTAPDKTAPSIPTGLGAAVLSANQVNVNWHASTDNVGVDHYDLYRGNTKVASVNAALATDSNGTVQFGDTTTLPRTTYSYWIYAFDAAGNKSASSAKISVITPAVVSGLGSITGVLKTTTGLPISGAKVTYTLNNRATSVSTSSTGNYVISSLPPTPSPGLNLTYTITGYVPQSQPVIVTANANTVATNLSLPKLGIVTGTIISNTTNLPLRAKVTYTVGGRSTSVTAATNGSFTLASLPPGPLTLTISLSSYQTQTVTVNVAADSTAPLNTITLVHL